MILIALGILSCSDLDRPNQLEEIDTLDVRLDSMYQELAAIDTAVVLEMIASKILVGNKLDALNADTIAYNLGLQLDQYKLMGNYSDFLAEHIAQLSSSIGEEISALDVLRGDIENGSGRRDKYDQYISFEKEKIDTLNSRFEQYMDMFDQALMIYNDLHADLIEQLDVLELNREQLLQD